jgi:hypothetical protein
VPWRLPADDLATYGDNVLHAFDYIFTGYLQTVTDLLGYVGHGECFLASALSRRPIGMELLNGWIERVDPHTYRCIGKLLPMEMDARTYYQY